MVEGVGFRPPKRVRVRVSREDLSLARHLTRQRLIFRGYDLSDDEWKRGAIGTYRAVYVGFVGEMAFRNWVHKELGVWLELDTEPRRGGDGGIDFWLEGYGIQVKTATTDYDELFVRTKDVSGPADGKCAAWDYIVRAHWPARGPGERSGGLFDAGRRFDYESAELTGCVGEREFLGLSTIKPGQFSDHHNYVIRPERFKPMSALADMARARALRRQRNAH